MPIGFILRQAGLKMGLDAANSDERNVLLRYLNEATIELYDQADTDEMLMEQVFLVDGNQQIALPPNVGPIRAMRENNTYIAWHLHNQRARYNQFNWTDRWRNWRVKGTTALMYPLVNQSQIIVEVPAVETPAVVVTILGASQTSSSIAAEYTMDALSKNSTVDFIDITNIKKDRVTTYDVNVKDIDGNVLATLPNNMLSMRYRLVDVSLYPWEMAPQSGQDHVMEVLYKKALPWFDNDDDEYVVQGMDNIIVNKMLQLYYEEKGDGQSAIAYDAKATRSLARKKNDEDRGVEEHASIVANPHDTLLARNRSCGPYRYSGNTYYY